MFSLRMLTKEVEEYILKEMQATDTLEKGYPKKRPKEEKWISCNTTRLSAEKEIQDEGAG